MKQNLTTIHKLPRYLFSEILEVYIYQGYGLEELTIDLRDILKDTPERLLLLEVYKQDLKAICLEAGLSYQNTYREFLLGLSWLYMVSKPFRLEGWDIVDIAISENLDVIFYYKLHSKSQVVGNRSGWFRYNLPFQSVWNPGSEF